MIQQILSGPYFIKIRFNYSLLFSIFLNSIHCFILNYLRCFLSKIVRVVCITDFKWTTLNQSWILMHLTGVSIHRCRPRYLLMQSISINKEQSMISRGAWISKGKIVRDNIGNRKRKKNARNNDHQVCNSGPLIHVKFFSDRIGLISFINN